MSKIVCQYENNNRYMINPDIIKYFNVVIKKEDLIEQMNKTILELIGHTSS